MAEINFDVMPNGAKADIPQSPAIRFLDNLMLGLLLVLGVLETGIIKMDEATLDASVPANPTLLDKYDCVNPNLIQKRPQ